MKREDLHFTALIAAGLGISLMAAGCSSDDDTSTLVEVASASSDHSILTAALERSGLDSALEGDGPFTVLAPTEEAFARLPAGLLDQIDLANGA